MKKNTTVRAAAGLSVAGCGSFGDAGICIFPEAAARTAHAGGRADSGHYCSTGRGGKQE